MEVVRGIGGHVRVGGEGRGDCRYLLVGRYLNVIMYVCASTVV